MLGTAFLGLPAKKCQVRQLSHSPSSTAANELNAYLEEKWGEVEASKYWEHVGDAYPLMKKVAEQMLVVPATSAPVESFQQWGAYN